MPENKQTPKQCNSAIYWSWTTLTAECPWRKISSLKALSPFKPVENNVAKDCITLFPSDNISQWLNYWHTK